MSKVFGVNVDVAFTEHFAFNDEWVDAIYTALERNMTIQSVDLGVREDEATLSFLIGVQTFLENTPEAASELVNDALDRAIDSASQGPVSNDWTITRSEVLQAA